jgi:uncharacterized protein YkwD
MATTPRRLSSTLLGLRMPCLVLAVAACAPNQQGAPPKALPRGYAASPPAGRASEPRRSGAAGTSPTALGRGQDSGEAPRRGLTVADARRYMVDLINRDRASIGLAPVVFDDGSATRAGQAHAEDMATKGYLGHWGTDGSVPEQRFTDAGGVDMVLENASCFTDEKTRTLDRAPRIDPKNVELTEDLFFHEQPPHDGHRRNILKPWHKKVGIGVAQPAATPTEIPAPCFAQEFVDPYGLYAAAPRKLHVGDVLHVSGTILAPATFAGVGLARVDKPEPLPVSELNRRRSYPVPMPYQMYWPPGYQTPIPVKVTGNQFTVDLPVSDGGKAGLYELSVWANLSGERDAVMVSLRTMVGTPAR